MTHKRKREHNLRRAAYTLGYKGAFDHGVRKGIAGGRWRCGPLERRVQHKRAINQLKEENFDGDQA
jgi:hypothetical protein